MWGWRSTDEKGSLAAVGRERVSGVESSPVIAAGGGEIVGWHCTKRGGKSADSETVLVSFGKMLCEGGKHIYIQHSMPMDRILIINSESGYSKV